MATTQEILDAAAELGKLIATHPAAVKFEDTIKKLQDDVEAQRLMTDLNRHMESLQEKEANGKPIEVADKKKLSSKSLVAWRAASMTSWGNLSARP